MNPPHSAQPTNPAQSIPDTQSARDERHLVIQHVGVKDVRYPFSVEVAGAPQAVQGLWNLGVALPAEKKGTHMSRLVAWLDELHTSGETLTAARLQQRHAQMLNKLEASEGRIETRFHFFIRKRAPVSALASMLDYEARWISETRAGHTALWAEVAVPVKALCPCSKEISDYGAHNQRARITVRAEVRDAANPPPWHELVRYAEEEASSEIWPMLKRPDEKWVTEHAYDNPKFVEDLVRDVALRVAADSRIGRYRVEVENFESIHNHSAVARVERW